MFRSRCGALPHRLPTMLCTYPSLRPSQLRSTYPSRSWDPPSTVATTGTVQAAVTTVLPNSQRRPRTARRRRPRPHAPPALSPTASTASRFKRAKRRPCPRGMFETRGQTSVSTPSTPIKSLCQLSAASAEAPTQRRRARRSPLVSASFVRLVCVGHALQHPLYTLRLVDVSVCRLSRWLRLSVCAVASRSSSHSSPAAWSSFGALSASAWRCVWRLASRVLGLLPISRVL